MMPQVQAPEADQQSKPFQPGDVLAFYGSGFTSRVIEFYTRGPSHVGIIAGHPFQQAHSPVLWESTSLCTEDDILTGHRISGVQAHDPQTRVQNYDGPVYLYRLVPAWELSCDEIQLLTRFLTHFHGGRYDFPGAGLSGSYAWKFLRHRYPNPYAWFCSELCAAALQRLGRFPDKNPSYVNPANLVKGLMALGRYTKPVQVTRFPYHEREPDVKIFTPEPGPDCRIPRE